MVETYKVGTPLFALGANVQGFQAKEEALNLKGNVIFLYGNKDINKLITPLIRVFGDVDEVNPSVFSIVGGEKIGNATGRTTISGGKMYHEITVSFPAISKDHAPQGKRTRHLNFLGFEKAGTYEDHTSDGWFAFDNVTTDITEALPTYDASTDPLAKKTSTLTTASPKTTAQTQTIIYIIAGFVVIGILAIFAFKKKK
jgi:LPXTG-motif cell wall-anchored protein